VGGSIGPNEPAKGNGDKSLYGCLYWVWMEPWTKSEGNWSGGSKVKDVRVETEAVMRTPQTKLWKTVSQ